MKRIVLALMAMMLTVIPALAQPATGVTDTGYGYLGAGLGFGLAAGLAALGHGKIASAACEGAARNPGAAGKSNVFRASRALLRKYSKALPWN